MAGAVQAERSLAEELSLRRLNRQTGSANKNMKKDDYSSFQTVWKIGSRNEKVAFKATGCFTIDWGDGCVETGIQDPHFVQELEHKYVKPGTYTVSISSGINEFNFLYMPNYNELKLIEIKQWGTAHWKNMHSMFDGAENMVCTATDAPDLSKVDDMSLMFRDCWKFNSPIEHWDTKGVKTMSSMLSGALMFNRSLANMDLRNVVDTFHMLNDTPAFVQDLRDLNIGAKANTRNLFGQNKSLAQYNEEQAERYAAQEEKQDVYSVLSSAGPA